MTTTPSIISDSRRRDIELAIKKLREAGWTVDDDGTIRATPTSKE